MRAASRVGYGVPTVRIYREVGVCVAGCAYGMLLAPAAGHTRLAQLVVMVMVINSAYTGPLPHYL